MRARLIPSGVRPSRILLLTFTRRAFEQIEVERRLFYMALTPAKDFLDVCVPLRHYHKKWATGDRHTYAQLTRFLPEAIQCRFERVLVESTATQKAGSR